MMTNWDLIYRIKSLKFVFVITVTVTALMPLKPSKQNEINPKRTVALDWDLVSYGYSGQEKETRGRSCPQVNSGSSGGVR